LIVRQAGFEDPNAVLADLSEMISRNRQILEDALSGQVGNSSTCGIVLLGRRELGVAQSASPVTLPAWFPVGPGETLDVVIRDLTWAADAPINAAEVRIPDLCGQLFTLEGLLIRRLLQVHDQDHNLSNALFEAIRRDKESFSEMLSKATAYRSQVTAPDDFRPSLTEGRSLICRLWALVQAANSDALVRPAKALATGLKLTTPQVAAGWYQSLQAVLRRPSARNLQPEYTVALTLLVCVASACQLITASHHAAEYGPYPVSMLQALSIDLRRSLGDIEFILTSGWQA
jgi:hypothetical protein